MKAITPHLWFDKEAKEAAEFYVSVFPKSKITQSSVLKNTPSGDCDLVSFELAGQPFMAISAGPLFKFNPSISFLLNYDPATDPQARQHLDEAWAKLSSGGKALMPLDKYPFSEHYGWIQDRFGLSWQLFLAHPGSESRPFVAPALMFTGENAGRADEARRFWTSVFPDSKLGLSHPYGPGHEPDKPENLAFSDFTLMGRWFAAMDSAHPHGFTFNEAVSLLVPCENQKEIDELWSKLAADPDEGQCGWIKDKFGVSWQVSSTELTAMLSSGDQARIDRVTQAFLPMKKFDLSVLKKAWEGKK